MRSGKLSNDVVSVKNIGDLEHHGQTGQPFRWILGPNAFIYVNSSVDKIATLQYSFVPALPNQAIAIYINGIAVRKFTSRAKYDAGEKVSGSVNFRRVVGVNIIRIALSKWNGFDDEYFVQDPRQLGVVAEKLRVFTMEGDSSVFEKPKVENWH